MLTAPSKPRVVSIADEIANITQSKVDEDSEEEESNLVIEMPMEEEEPEKEKDSNQTEGERNFFIYKHTEQLLTKI